MMCSKQYTNLKTLKQHMQSHASRRNCEFCEKSFVRLENLHLHKKNKHSCHKERKQTLSSFTCTFCNKTFNRKYHLTRHQGTHQSTISRQTSGKFSCRHCDSEFQDYDELFHHVSELHPLNQQGGQTLETTNSANANDTFINDKKENPIADSSVADTMNNDDHAATSDVEIDQDNDIKQQHIDQPVDESALRNGVVNRYLTPSGSERYDALAFFANIRDRLRDFLHSRLHVLGGIKWNVCLHVEMQRDDGPETVVTSPCFRSLTYAALSADDINEHNLNEAMQKMYASLDTFMKEGSSWFIKKVLKLEIHTVVYKPLRGASYLQLPKSLALSGSILNIQNNDNKCFLYCLLARLHPTTMDPEHVEQYLQYEQEVNMNGITYPVTISQIGKVENQNENISVNVFTYENDGIVPLRITEKYNSLHHINLLWLKYEENSHYCLISDLNRFLSRTNKHKSQLYFCPYCLHGFHKDTLLQEHKRYCSRHGAQRADLPVPGKTDHLEFTDYEKTLRTPFVIYADFETINIKLQTCQPNPCKSATTSTTKLDVCGFGYKVVCEDERYTKPSVIYRGEDAGKRLIECLLQEQEHIQQILSNIEPMHITEEHNDLIKNAMQCCICKKRFTIYDKIYSRIVRHHNHFTGEIIGPACNVCNLNCQQATFIPVIFHNLKNFDSHILCKHIGHFKNHRLQCIAQNTERYVSFSLGSLRFIDSLQFLPASLENLVANLAQDGLQVFTHLLSETESEAKAQLLMRKGVYMYEYMDSFEKFDESELPPREQFYSTIKKEHISEEEYEQALAVFRTFNMTSLGEYHDLYLKTDVVLLSDVFESFRNLCLKQYELDPCRYYTSPGLSWSACLKISGVRLELLTDIDKILMVEVGTRGGVSQISNRYEKANNPYLQDYDPSMPTTYLQYLDANNLYGWAMVQPLPLSDFVFMQEKDIELFDVMSIPETGKTGYILEVSLVYPKHLHQSHNCLPLAPVRRAITNDELSPYAQYLLRKLYGLSEDESLPNRGKVEKLLTTLEDKEHYVLHYRNLQLYLRLGMKLKSIHRILKFTQATWMKTYIDQNTEMRKKAKSTFQKNFYKLMNVSVFGKVS